VECRQCEAEPGDVERRGVFDDLATVGVAVCEGKAERGLDDGAMLVSGGAFVVAQPWAGQRPAQSQPPVSHAPTKTEGSGPLPTVESGRAGGWWVKRMVGHSLSAMRCTSNPCE
jgi:hypothetical protein